MVEMRKLKPCELQARNRSLFLYLMHAHMKVSGYTGAWPTICRHCSCTFIICFPKALISPLPLKTGTGHFCDTFKIAQEMSENPKYQLQRVCMNDQLCRDEVQVQVKISVGQVIAPSLAVLGSPISLHTEGWQTHKYRRSSSGEHPLWSVNATKEYRNGETLWESSCWSTEVP